MHQRWLNLLALCAIALTVTACGGKESEEAAGQAVPARDITAEVQQYYADHPDFFSFRTPADLPDDLEWVDGNDLPDIGSPRARKGGTQRGALADFPRTLRVVGPDSNGSFRPWILDDTTLSLAHRHPDAFVFYPGLALSWAVSPERKTVYVRLDPDARWSDGVPVTADDFMFMFFFYQSRYILAPWYNNYYGTQYTNVTRYDEHTLSISVPAVKPDMDARVLGLSPVPSHFYRELGDDFVERYQWRFVPTTGPYFVRDEDIRKGRSITLTRLKDWWAQDKKFWRYRYNADRIHLSVIRDTSKIFEAFRRGDIDMFGLNLAEYWYEKLPDSDPDVQSGYIGKAVFYNVYPRAPYGLWINTARPLLDNRDIRIGINYATDWQLVIDKYFRGDYVRLNTENDGYGEFTHPTIRARPYEVDKALEHFARAGFDRRGPDGILVNAGGQRLSFTLSNGFDALNDVMTILKEQAANAGLEFRIETLDDTAHFKKVLEKKHDIAFSAWGYSLEMYPRYWETKHSENAYDVPFLPDGRVNPDRKLKVQTNNIESFAVREFDELIERYRASESKAEMIELAHRMDEMHHDYGSFVPGFAQPFFRVGYWRWVGWPEGFSYKYSQSAGELFVHWIDEEARRETLDARKSGKAFSPQIRVYDQWRGN